MGLLIFRRRVRNFYIIFCPNVCDWVCAQSIQRSRRCPDTAKTAHRTGICTKPTEDYCNRLVCCFSFHTSSRVSKHWLPWTLPWWKKRSQTMMQYDTSWNAIANNSYAHSLTFIVDTIQKKGSWISLNMSKAEANVPAGVVRGRTWHKLLWCHDLCKARKWKQLVLWRRTRQVDVVELSATTRIQCQVRGSYCFVSRVMYDKKSICQNEITFQLFLAIGDPSLSWGLITTYEHQERVFLQKPSHKSVKISIEYICQSPDQCNPRNLWQRLQLRRCTAKIETDNNLSYSSRCIIVHINASFVADISANSARNVNSAQTWSLSSHNSCQDWACPNLYVNMPW